MKDNNECNAAKAMKESAETATSELLERALLHTTPSGRYDPNYTRPIERRTGGVGLGKTLEYKGKTHTNLVNPADILTPKELANRLKVPEGWVFEKTRARCENPIPCLHMGRFVRFDWPSVVAWLESEAVTQSNRDSKIGNAKGTKDAKRPNHSTRQ